MRLQKFLRDCGIGSRRKCDLLVSSKQVYINDTLVSEPTKYLKNGDTVRIQKKVFTYDTGQSTTNIYLLFNKPVNVVSSSSDEYNRKLVFDYLKNIPEMKHIKKRLIYAGRLDYKSRGLMIFSTNGDFIQKLSHPSQGHKKEYIIKTKSAINVKVLNRLSKGFVYEGETYAPFTFNINSPKRAIVILTEGKKQEVRNIFKAAGNEVIDLLRTKIGPYSLGDLKEGTYKLFTPI
jgi:23S rRNA pseudouridine2605 synthase